MNRPMSGTKPLTGEKSAIAAAKSGIQEKVEPRRVEAVEGWQRLREVLCPFALKVKLDSRLPFEFEDYKCHPYRLREMPLYQAVLVHASRPGQFKKVSLKMLMGKEIRMGAKNKLYER
ncbi:MAG: hypothetical protein WAK31_16845 [Chthoniobacterales bacterium]